MTSAAPPPLARSTLTEVALTFGRLGLTSFGGPIAHLGYLHTEAVTRRQWLGSTHFGDLVALCQVLPGPTSSQVVFALGHERAGLVGALVASASFTLPSAALMLAVAQGLAAVEAGSGWLRGLGVVAVAVVAHAVWTMAQSLCPDRARASVCLAAAALLLVVPGPATQLAVLAGAAALGGLRHLLAWEPLRGQPTAPVPASELSRDAPALASSPVRSALPLALWAALLLGLPVLAGWTQHPVARAASVFYRAGSLVFGGGHVVLPLLRVEVVPSWMTDDVFLAGYAAAQALPGPLFSFAAYLGATIPSELPSWAMAFSCLVAVFLPGWLLVLGALPCWARLRTRLRGHAALGYLNASVVGVLLAALYNPIVTEGVRSSADAAAALVGFGLLQVGKAPSWLVVVLGAAFGQLVR